MSAQAQQLNFVQVWFAPQRLLGFALLATLLSVVAVLGYFALQQYQRPFDKVAVTGSYQFVDRAQLKSLVKSQTEAGFFALDILGLKKSLEEMAWVKQADVSRQWPGVLNIVIEEQKAKYYWGNKGYFNAQGELFMVEKLIDVGDLPVIDCSQNLAAKTVKNFQQIDALLQTKDISIKRLSFDAAAGISLMTDRGFQLYLGNNNYQAKVDRFLFALEKGLAQKLDSVASVDLRYSNGLAVAWLEREAGKAKLASTMGKLQ